MCLGGACRSSLSRRFGSAGGVSPRDFLQRALAAALALAFLMSGVRCFAAL